jgi:rhamnulose-1-phosphate aldolase/alcohol dehydrogenase
MENLWRDDEAAGLAGLDLLVHRSRLIGRDAGLVLRGAGNTSLKQDEVDFRGRTIPVLRIKGSGRDLAAAVSADFAGLRMDDLAPLRERDAMTDEAMVDWLLRCLLDPGSPRPSIETLLHAFLPHPHVDHTHADAVLAITDTADPRRTVTEAFEGSAVLVRYRRPGFALATDVARAAASTPGARAVVLEKHGLITWGNASKACYENTIATVSRAEEYLAHRARGRAVFGAIVRPQLPAEERRRVAARMAPRLRGLLAGGGETRGHVIVRYDDRDEVLDFVGREASAQVSLAGPATPDHLMYIRARPLWLSAPEVAATAFEGAAAVPGAPSTESLRRDLDRYVSWYETYDRKHASEEDATLDRRPRVLLAPGIGMFTAWTDAARADLVAEVERHAIAVMRGAEGLGGYRSLGHREMHDVETWPLELYRMSLAPKPRELEGRVALVTGAARGIGRATAIHLAASGCHVVVTDRERAGVEALARAIEAEQGPGRALALGLDVTDEAGVARAFEAAVLAYGGLDILVSNAGIAHVGPIDGMELADWRRSFEVNATGHFLVARAAVPILKEQGTGGSLIFVASKNVLAPGKDFGAYSASKAAQAQLARILAIENGAYGVRVNMINPDAVFQDSGLWSAELREERARAHGIAPEALEEFYRKRNLLATRVTAEDVAEAALWLAGDRSARTTGCIITVDGGVREAFPR